MPLPQVPSVDDRRIRSGDMGAVADALDSLAQTVNQIGLSTTGVSGARSAGVQTATVVFDHEAILAWPTSDLILLPPPLPGWLLSPSRVEVIADIWADYGNVHVDAYLNIHTADWQQELFSYLVNGNATGLTQVSQLLAPGVPQQALWTPPLFVNGNGAPSVAFGDDWGLVRYFVDVPEAQAQPLVASCENVGAGALTGGDVRNTLTVIIDYKKLRVRT